MDDIRLNVGEIRREEYTDQADPKNSQGTSFAGKFHFRSQQQNGGDHQIRADPEHRNRDAIDNGVNAVVDRGAAVIAHAHRF